MLAPFATPTVPPASAGASAWAGPTVAQERAGTRPAVAGRRWVEPDIEDRTAFLSAHPECVVDEALLSSLEPEIWWRATRIENSTDPEIQADLRAEIRMRIIEAATAYRDIDEQTGSPVFDYMNQTRRYIVWHAAGRVFSSVRRDRAAQKSLGTVPIEVSTADGELRNRLATTADPEADLARASTLEASELALGIRARLSPAQVKVFDLLSAGYERAEIGEALGLTRKTVHDHIVKIREATTAALANEPLAEAAIERRARALRTAPRPQRPSTVGQAA